MIKRALVLSAFLLTGSAYLSTASRPEQYPIRQALEFLPLRLGLWKGEDTPPIDERTLKVLGVDDYVNRVYTSPSGQVYLYIGYYESQREGDSIHSPRNCLPAAGWNPVANGILEIPVSSSGNLSSIRVNRIVILNGTDKEVVLYWYQSHGRTVASEYWAKIYTVVDALRTNRTDAALVRVICPANDMSDQAEQAAERNALSFAQTLFPLIPRYLPD
jgi:EpsI family protein